MPPGKNIYSTTVCDNCRRRKVKCDGNLLSCSNCTSSKRECKYTFGADKRRISSKKTIESQAEHIKLLESILQAHGIPLPTYHYDLTPYSDENSYVGSPDGSYSQGGPIPYGHGHIPDGEDLSNISTLVEDRSSIFMPSAQPVTELHSQQPSDMTLNEPFQVSTTFDWVTSRFLVEFDDTYREYNHQNSPVAGMQGPPVLVPGQQLHNFQPPSYAERSNPDLQQLHPGSSNY